MEPDKNQLDKRYKEKQRMKNVKEYQDKFFKNLKKSFKERKKKNG